LGERSVEVSVAPGNYLLKLRRDRNGAKEILNVPVILRNAGAELRVDVSHWAPEAGASHLEGTNPAGAPNLRNTRWTITQADWDVAKSASDPKLSQILRTALGQVGVYEKGSEADKAAVLGYFKNTNFPASLQTPWGGAFLDWVMGQSGAPITRSPAFASWQTWGSAIPVGEAQPGMIAIFDFPGLPEAPSKLVVGIFLRRTPACTEIIAGNIVNRVVITCVAGTPKMLRNPNLV
jgi:hypothetical protein